jgi:hypothetical protein
MSRTAASNARFRCLSAAMVWLIFLLIILEELTFLSCQQSKTSSLAEQYSLAPN